MASRTRRSHVCTSLAALAAALLAGCGIDGTGVQAPEDILAYGRITEFGSVWVNGVRYDIGGADFTINGEPGSEADLKIGDVVLVHGRRDSATSRMVADSLALDDLLLAPVDSIDAQTGTITALGQTVTIIEDTVFDGSIPQGIMGLATGDVISVSGFRNVARAIVATNIARPAAATTIFKTIGAVTALSTDAPRFNVNALEIDYSAVADTAIASLALGDIVEVRGSLRNPIELEATNVEIRGYVAAALPGQHSDVEGFLTHLDSRTPEHFELAGLPVITASDTVIEGTPTLGDPLRVDGVIDPNGMLLAQHVSSPRSISGIHTVTGRVYETYSGPVANTTVSLFVVTAAGYGYSYWMARHGPLVTDQDGRFEAPGIPDSTITIFAGQPCAVIAPVTSDVEVDVEVVNPASYNSTDPPRPQSSHGVSLSGNIYEMTDAGRQPVVGASIWAAHTFEIWMAATQSDLLGNYFLCNLPPETHLYITAPGFADSGLGFPGAQIGPIDTSQSSTLDIELHRPASQ